MEINQKHFVMSGAHMMLGSKWSHILTAAAALSMGLGVAHADESEGFLMRGGGQTRETLNAMQLKHAELPWTNLSDWTGTAPTAEALKDKVLLIVTWSSWHKASGPAMRAAQEMSTKYGEKGLVVVGVHNPRGFDSAKKNIEELGVTFPYAADKDGKFRSAIKADADPNLYLIDRSGQMRLAQVELSSLDDAIAKLVGETAEQAGAIPGELAAKRSQEEAEKWKTREVAEKGPIGEVKYTAPGEEAYKTANWPIATGKIEVDPILGKVSITAPVLTLADDHWTPSKPKNAGKLTVVYFFDPADREMTSLTGIMNEAQNQYTRDVVVVASAVMTGQKWWNVDGKDKDKLTERNEKVLKSFIASHVINHSVLTVPVKIEGSNDSLSNQTKGLRYIGDGDGAAFILSTDGRLRWGGNPHDPLFKTLLQQIADVDPGVRARRAAEDR